MQFNPVTSSKVDGRPNVSSRPPWKSLGKSVSLERVGLEVTLAAFEIKKDNETIPENSILAPLS